MEAFVPPGGGPPPHYHTREEEIFYILEGEMSFMVDGRSIEAPVGTFVQVPRGTPHTFKNKSTAPVKMLIQCVPAGFERFLAGFATELPSLDALPLAPTPEEIEKLMRLAPEYGIVLLPPGDGGKHQ